MCIYIYIYIYACRPGCRRQNFFVSPAAPCNNVLFFPSADRANTHNNNNDTTTTTTNNNNDTTTTNTTTNSNDDTTTTTTTSTTSLLLLLLLMIMMIIIMVIVTNKQGLAAQDQGGVREGERDEGLYGDLTMISPTIINNNP